jgi:hypothetical protein
MGEKPLSTDEAPQPVTVAAGGPIGGFDTPPPGSSAAASVNTTRSNIRNQGVAAHDPATEAGDGGRGVADEAATAEPASGAAGFAIKEQGVRRSTQPAAEPTEPGASMDGDPIPGIDVKLGKNPGGSFS